MSSHWSTGAREIGSRVQYRTGYITVKVVNNDGEEKIMAESRRVWELHHGELEAGDRVFHCNGDRTDNRIQNLAMVHFNQTKFIVLKQSLKLPSWDEVWGKGRKPKASTKSSLVLPEARPRRLLRVA